ncbi:MAG: sigma 54-interacting transcriptional regulator, partial [Anaerovorax sp.]
MMTDLFDKIVEKLKAYGLAIEDVGFAAPEREKLKEMPKTEEELLDVITMVLDANDELNRICDGSNTSMYVSDKDGVTLRINKVFETMVKGKREEFLGKNVWQLDEEGIFRPSVCALALKERRTVAVLQEVNDVTDMAVTGVPIFDRNGHLFRAVTNALLLEYIESMTKYINGHQMEEHDYSLREIIAESTAMKAVLDLADRVKNTESSILITGETGVGKGVLSRYIHETGNRKEKPMVNINCGAIPFTLLESELFGYESGAFTGAGSKGKPGLIELSNEGTLFLDEISELPLLLQVKLLHFIQSKKMIRVGGTKE